VVDQPCKREGDLEQQCNSFHFYQHYFTIHHLASQTHNVGSSPDYTINNAVEDIVLINSRLPEPSSSGRLSYGLVGTGRKATGFVPICQLPGPSPPLHDHPKKNGNRSDGAALVIIINHAVVDCDRDQPPKISASPFHFLRNLLITRARYRDDSRQPPDAAVQVPSCGGDGMVFGRRRCRSARGLFL
jgi:hypothetical protein